MAVSRRKRTEFSVKMDIQKPKQVVISDNWLRYGMAIPLLFLLGCQHQPPEANALFWQQDSTKTNIGFINKLPEDGQDKLSILDYVDYYNGGGVAAGDINNDGLTDLFFVSNRDKNKLYLNNGKQQNSAFSFEDISLQAGIEGKSEWQTGVSMLDINGDGWLDIYVCAVSGHLGLQGSNELYINQGPNEAGTVSFLEEAAAWGLDFEGFSTQAAFFDYDRDGDLDMYLLNHSVQTPLTINNVTVREFYDPKAGDRFYENQLIRKGVASQQKAAVKFKDVSKQAGIYQSAIGYGLGVAVADLNNDGWEDIYVANDFHEDDYYYINQGDGTFKESIRQSFAHVSRFSMGCDAADINNDGYPDLMTLDMYPEDETVQKSTSGEDPFEIYRYKLNFGYFHQYSRNALQLSLTGQKFTDIGVMAGVAATDWSWSTLLADFDNDGLKDVFVANGIARRPNDLDYLKYGSGHAQFRQTGSRSAGVGAISLMPEGKVHNYLFRGTHDLRFEDRSAEWGFEAPSLSNGAAYADLDNDGDLDLITNNLNEPAGIWENRSEKRFQHNYLKIKLQGEGANTFGLGAKVYVKHKGQLQMQQLMPVRGFLSSVEPQLLFGFGKTETPLDTLVVVWNNQRMEVKTGVLLNSTLVLEQANAEKDAQEFLQQLFPIPEPLFEEVSDVVSLSYLHQENYFFDLNREGLMPFMLSTEGPKLAVGDVNGDGMDDFYAGGAKGKPGQLYLQGPETTFQPGSGLVFEADAVHEDIDAVFFDADGDGDPDLYVASGGNELNGEAQPLLDRLYLNDGKGRFSRDLGRLPQMYTNTSCVRPFDFDADGDLDLFVGGRVVSGRYGYAPDSYLLINDGKGTFTDRTDELAPGLRKAGMVTDAQWTDYDDNGKTDLVVVGDWMPVKLFNNQSNHLTEVPSVSGLEQSNGFWQSIAVADVDGDGDQDFVLGNLGTNTKLQKKKDASLRMYVKDIDGNGSADHILSYPIGDQWYPLASKDELAKQMPFINKRFNDYQSFAGKPLNKVFEKKELVAAVEHYADRFESVYLENLGNGKFRQHLLPAEAQVSKVFSLYVADVDGDGFLDILMGGNYAGVSTYQGRYDGSHGLLLKGNGKGGFTPNVPTTTGLVLEGEVRDIKSLKTPAGTLLLIARNNLPLQVFKIKPPASAHLASHHK